MWISLAVGKCIGLSPVSKFYWAKNVENYIFSRKSLRTWTRKSLKKRVHNRKNSKFLLGIIRHAQNVRLSTCYFRTFHSIEKLLWALLLLIYVTRRLIPWIYTPRQHTYFPLVYSHCSHYIYSRHYIYYSQRLCSISPIPLLGCSYNHFYILFSLCFFSVRSPIEPIERIEHESSERRAQKSQQSGPNSRVSYQNSCPASHLQAHTDYNI